MKKLILAFTLTLFSLSALAWIAPARWRRNGPVTIPLVAVMTMSVCRGVRHVL